MALNSVAHAVARVHVLGAMRWMKAALTGS